MERLQRQIEEENKAIEEAKRKSRSGSR